MEIIEKLETRIFTSEFKDELMALYARDMMNGGTDLIEQEYLEGIDVLRRHLAQDDLENVRKMEALFETNINYAMRFGFKQGICSLFEVYFNEDTVSDLFYTYVVQRLLQMPGMQAYPEYYDRHREINAVYLKLCNAVDEQSGQALLSVYGAWEERVYGVLRHSFSAGYRWALSVLCFDGQREL